MPPLDPNVADLAPSTPVLTAYDEEHAVTYIRMLDADAEGADWREVAASYCILILSRSRIALGEPTTAIWHARSGWRGTDTGNCSEAAGL